MTSISSDGRSVTLANGQVLRADVVVGADGTNGLSRELFEDEEAGPPKMNLYRWSGNSQQRFNDLICYAVPSYQRN